MEAIDKQILNISEMFANILRGSCEQSGPTN